MPSEPPSREVRLPLAHLLIPLATGAAIFTYGSAQVERAAAVETLYLAVVACAALVPIAALAVRPALELTVTAVLVTLAAWVIPAGPTRGVAVVLVLLLGLAIAVARGLLARGLEVGLSFAIPAAVGIQLIARSDQLLAVSPDAKTLAGLLGLPLVAGIAVAILAREHGPGVALVGAATLAILAPGWGVAAALALAAMAAGSLARRTGWPTWTRWGAVALVVAAAFAWQPPLAAVLVLAVAADWSARSWRLSLPISVVALATTLAFPAVRGWDEVLAGLAVVLLLLPSLVAASAGRRASLAAGLALGAAALRIVAGPDALAAPLLIVALTLAGSGTAARLQRLWSALLLGGAVMLAAYPWLRQEALADLLRLVGLGLDWPSALKVTAAGALVTVAYRLVGDRSRREALPEAAGLAVLGLAAWMALPAVGTRPLGDRIVSLTSASPRVQGTLPDGATVSRIVLDSYLADSTSLAAGTTVAVLELTGPPGETRSWPIALGRDTGEWAARRPDVVALPGFEAPPPWLGWVAPSGDLFAQRYRGTHDLETPIDALSFKLTRSPDLPPGLSMAVFHLELRP